MSTERPIAVPSEAAPASAVADLLAGYLLTAARFHCPGMDGATVAEVVIAEYRTAADAGWVPRPEDLALRHPDLADALAGFFPVE